MRNSIIIVLLCVLGMVYWLFGKQMDNNDISLPSKEEKSARIMSVATGGGIPQTGLEMKQLVIGGIPVVAETADNDEKRRVGEMFRGKMGAQDAMIFVFNEEQEMSFRMEHTYIGLDILFIGSDGIIKHMHDNAKPLDLTPLPSTVPVQYVIEVRDDFIEQFGVKVGDKVEGI